MYSPGVQENGSRSAEEVQAKQIIQRQGDVGAMLGNYRGWAGVGGGYAQVLERQLWKEHGWDWFACAKAGEIVDQDASDDPQWADERLCY